MVPARFPRLPQTLAPLLKIRADCRETPAAGGQPPGLLPQGSGAGVETQKAAA